VVEELVELPTVMERQVQTLQDLDIQLQVVDLVETLEQLVDLVDLVVVQDEILLQRLVVLEQLVKVIMEVLNKEIRTDLLVGEEALGKQDLVDGGMKVLELKVKLV
jgi:hypothetical protein